MEWEKHKTILAVILVLLRELRLDFAIFSIKQWVKDINRYKIN